MNAMQFDKAIWHTFIYGQVIASWPNIVSFITWRGIKNFHSKWAQSVGKSQSTKGGKAHGNWKKTKVCKPVIIHRTYAWRNEWSLSHKLILPSCGHCWKVMPNKTCTVTVNLKSDWQNTSDPDKTQVTLRSRDFKITATAKEKTWARRADKEELLQSTTN